MKISRKSIIYLGPLVLVLIIGVVYFFFIFKRQQVSPVMPIGGPAVSISTTQTFESKTFTDNENGISFSYPANFSVGDFTNKTSVAGLILTTKESTGSITLKIQEPANAYTLKEWLPTYKEATRAATVLGVTIAEEKGSQYVFATPSTLRQAQGELSLRVTAMFHQGVLYLFEGVSDRGGIFDKTYDNLLSSFAFLPEPTSGGNEGDGGDAGDVEYLGEEVVE